jgi:hypothetical protein
MSEKTAATSIILKAWTLLGLLLFMIALGTSGCDQQSSEQLGPPPLTVRTTKILYPPEARSLMINAIERFNAKNFPLSNGAVARATGASFDDYAAVDKIGSSPYQASLWIPPLSSLALSTKSVAKGEIEIGECRSLMSTRLGVALRPIDTFTLPADERKLSISSLLSSEQNSIDSRIAILMGRPRFSSSGLLAALTTAAEVQGVPIEQVSPDNISTSIVRLAKTQERVRNYFISDQDALTWLAARGGGDPIMSITTEQAMRALKASHPSINLKWFPFPSPFSSQGPSLDYPLCDIISKRDEPSQVEAAKLALRFFSSEEFKSLATEAGFSSPLSNGNTTNTELGKTIANLITSWPQIRRPASTIFVVDASIKTLHGTMKTIRRELTLFTNNRPSKEDSIAIVSASSVPQVSTDPTTDPELLRAAISRLSTAGGNAIRDGIEMGFTIIENLSPTGSRRSIVVVTSAKDTSSQTTVEQLTNRASQLVGRRNVDLFVIALGGSEADFGELPTLTRKVGGNFVLTDLASLPGRFYAIAQQIQ